MNFIKYFNYIILITKYCNLIDFNIKINTFLSFIREEKKRHRNQILEISHFFDFQREEFHKLQQRQEFILTKLNKDVGEVDEENEETIQDSGKDLSREEINEDEVQEYDSSVDIKKYYDNEKYNYEKEDVGEFDNENNAYIYPDSISNE